ncbi:MAG: EF hand [Candidatus Nitrotoga sp. SPKER]|nr:MAG: EF hand [Candidatus Nitrotoga sp. SPKER]
MKKTFMSLVITSCFVLSPAIAQADSSKGKMQENMFKAMDTNSDGMITREESNSFREKKFQEMDLNNDGQISGPEMKAAHKTMDGSGSVRNKMDDEGKDPKGMERSTDMSGDRDHQSVRHGDSDRSQSERTKSGASNNQGSYRETGNPGKDKAASGKILNQERLKIENRDEAMDPTGSAGKSSSPSGS